LFFFDGSFGTYYKQITKQDTLPEHANINNPDIVFKIHKGYVNAGSNAITTNTFCANSLAFSTKEEIEDCIKRGYEIAKKAAGNNTMVFADIGYVYDNSNEIFDNPQEEYLFIADTFLKLGAKNFLFETFAEYEVAKHAMKYIRQHDKDATIHITFAVSPDGLTSKGLNYIDLIKSVVKDNLADGTGLNCICGPAHIKQLMAQLIQTENINLKLIAMPNSGYPSRVDNMYFYDNNSSYFAKVMAEIADLGISILGGCCGTSPVHIERMIDYLTNKKASILNTNDIGKRKEKDNEEVKRSVFSQKLEKGEKPIAVELDPPLDTDIGFLVSSAQELKKHGADVLTFADSPLSRTRACSFLTASRIKREADVDVMPHMTCRDKNNIGISSTLIGGAIDGIGNILCVTGDPASHGTKGVFSFNSYNLIEYVNRMNSEYFKSTPYFIGAALNTSAPNFKNELARALKKEEMGANFFMTQPIYSKENIKNLKEAKKSLNSYILAGILPFASYKNALFLNNEVSGIEIPKEVLDSLEGKSNEEVREISISYALDITDKVYDICDGLYIMIPLKRTDIVIEILEKVKSRRKI
jgi:methionine synthase I (cobalamin-dependent)/5,10-methylenetetrahydrofolate reductase